MKEVNYLGENQDLHRIREIYTDGGLITPNPSGVGGAWAWCALDSNRILLYAQADIVLVPSGVITNNTTETMAIVKALEFLPDGWDGTLVSDSEVALARVFGSPQFKGCPTNVRIRLHKAVNRLNLKNYIHVAGHPTKKMLEGQNGYCSKTNLPLSDKFNQWGERLPCSVHNKYVDALCREVIKEYKATEEGQRRIEEEKKLRRSRKNVQKL